jgi:hypothetical protein
VTPGVETPFPGPVALTEQELADNEERFLRLAEVVAGGQAVALVGAGSSISAGYPSWNVLLEALASVAERCASGFLGQPAVENKLEYAQAIRDWITRARSLEHFHAEIGKLFIRKPTLTPFHDDLLNLPFRAFTTTNYDTSLQAAAVRTGRVATRPTGLPVWQTDPRQVGDAIRALTDGPCLEYIIHLHGLCGAERGEGQAHTIVLTADDYETAYGLNLSGRSRRRRQSTEMPRLRMVLLALLLTRRVVFVGFSLDDPFVTEVLLSCAELGWHWGQSDHFAIMPIAAESAVAARANAERLKRDLAVESIFYEVREGDHSGRDELLRRLRTIIDGSETRMPAAARPPATPTTVATTPAWVISANRAHQKKVEGT